MDFCHIYCAISLCLNYRGSKIPGRGGGIVRVCIRKLGNSSSIKTDRMQAASSDLDAVHSCCEHTPVKMSNFLPYNSVSVIKVNTPIFTTISLSCHVTITLFLV